jgi:hypothetical protein
MNRLLPTFWPGCNELGSDINRLQMISTGLRPRTEESQRAESQGKPESQGLTRRQTFRAKGLHGGVPAVGKV